MQSMPARMHAWTARVADGVRGHADAGAVRLVGDRLELLVGVLLRAGAGAVRHHAAGRRDLDHLGAVADLVAHALRAPRCTPLAMPSATLSGMIPGASRWNTVRIEVAAVGRDGVAGRDDARTVVPALVDGALERHVEQVAAGLDHQAEVAHGREAGEQRRAGVHRAAQRAVHGVVLHAVHRDRQARRAVSGPPMRKFSSMSMSPGRSVTSPRSISVASGRRRSAGFTPTMRFPSTTITAGDRTSPASMSTQRSARRTIVVAHGDGFDDAVERRRRRSRGRAAGASTRPGTTP